MEYIEINGGRELSGEIVLSGAPTESGFNELSLTSLLSFNAAPLGIPVDIDLTIPYTGCNALLDAQLQGDFSVLNDAIPTFYINVEGGAQIGCTNPEATNYNVEASQDDGSCEFNFASSTHVTTCGGIFVASGGSMCN